MNYIINFYQLNSFNDELFNGNAILFYKKNNKTLLNCIVYKDPKYFGFLMMNRFDPLFKGKNAKNNNNLSFRSG